MLILHSFCIQTNRHSVVRQNYQNWDFRGHSDSEESDDGNNHTPRPAHQHHCHRHHKPKQSNPPTLPLNTHPVLMGKMSGGAKAKGEKRRNRAPPPPPGGKKGGGKLEGDREEGRERGRRGREEGRGRREGEKERREEVKGESEGEGRQDKERRRERGEVTGDMVREEDGDTRAEEGGEVRVCIVQQNTTELNQLLYGYTKQNQTLKHSLWVL